MRKHSTYMTTWVLLQTCTDKICQISDPASLGRLHRSIMSLRGRKEAQKMCLETKHVMHEAVLDPQDEDDLLEGVPADIRRSQKRRNFLIEKARNASIIGVSRIFATC